MCCFFASLNINIPLVPPPTSIPPLRPSGLFPLADNQHEPTRRLSSKASAIIRRPVRSPYTKPIQSSNRKVWKFAEISEKSSENHAWWESRAKLFTRRTRFKSQYYINGCAKIYGMSSFLCRWLFLDGTRINVVFGIERFRHSKGGFFVRMFRICECEKCGDCRVRDTMSFRSNIYTDVRR